MSRANQPAFPAYTGNKDNWVFGLTKREYFAAMAMQGMKIDHDGCYSETDRRRGLPEKEAMWRASAAVRIADAIIAALERKPE
jgi:hypothetical protein